MGAIHEGIREIRDKEGIIMHCRACDTLLSDFESTRRNKNTGEFMDLCNSCYQEVKHIIPSIERKDLMQSRDFDDDLSTEGSDELLYNNYRVHSSFNDINE